MIDVAIVGLARDCAATLPDALTHIDQLRGDGIRVNTFIGEDGSTDDTRQIIKQSANLIDTTQDQAVPRLERMARAREKLRQSVPSSAAVVLVVDFDGPFVQSVTSEWLEVSMARLSEGSEFALSAASDPYYDLLAFESDDVSFEGLDERIEIAKRNPLRYHGFKKRTIYAEQDRLTGRGEIRCISAFNGACLYLGSTYASGSYIPDDSTSWACEHVTFNRLLARDGSRMIVDPSLAVPAPEEHTRQSALAFYAGAIRKLVSRLPSSAHFG